MQDDAHDDQAGVRKRWQHFDSMEDDASKRCRLTQKMKETFDVSELESQGPDVTAMSEEERANLPPRMLEVAVEVYVGILVEKRFKVKNEDITELRMQHDTRYRERDAEIDALWSSSSLDFQSFMTSLMMAQGSTGGPMFPRPRVPPSQLSVQRIVEMQEGMVVRS